MCVCVHTCMHTWVSFTSSKVLVSEWPRSFLPRLKAEKRKRISGDRNYSSDRKNGNLSTHCIKYVNRSHLAATSLCVSQISKMKNSLNYHKSLMWCLFCSAIFKYILTCTILPSTVALLMCKTSSLLLCMALQGCGLYYSFNKLLSNI